MFKMLLASLTLICNLSSIWPLGHVMHGDPLIIINKSTNQLAYFKTGKEISEYPVSTGKTNDLTPEGLFTLTVKAKDPYYRKKDIPGGDAKNPLGARWLGFDAKGTDGRIYGIHGTNQPWSIGHYASNGCVRMKNEDVKLLFEQVPIGTKVYITRSSKSFKELAKEAGAL